MDPITLSLIITIGSLLALSIFVGIYYAVKAMLPAKKNAAPVEAAPADVATPAEDAAVTPVHAAPAAQDEVVDAAEGFDPEVYELYLAMKDDAEEAAPVAVAVAPAEDAASVGGIDPTVVSSTVEDLLNAAASKVNALFELEDVAKDLVQTAIDSAVQELAATKIQAVYRDYRARKSTKIMKAWENTKKLFKPNFNKDNGAGQQVIVDAGYVVEQLQGRAVDAAKLGALISKIKNGEQPTKKDRQCNLSDATVMSALGLAPVA